MNEIIDAEALQKRKAIPRYNIREVPIEEKNPKQKRIVEEIARIQREHGLIGRTPCDESCSDYRRGDCPTESWACVLYQKFRSG